VSDLTPFQIAALSELPKDGSPAAIRDDHAFVLRALPTLARVEQPLLAPHDMQRALGFGHGVPPMSRACLLAAGIALLYPPPAPAKRTRRVIVTPAARAKLKGKAPGKIRQG
jgi:hypothetical protein